MSDEAPIMDRARAISPEEKAEILADMAQIMEQSHLFKSLDPPGRERMLKGGYALVFQPNEALVTEGQKGAYMYLVMNGQVRVDTTGPTGKVKLAELGRGACVGEVSVITQSPRTATVTAMVETKCVAFEREHVVSVIEDYPKVRRLLEMLVKGRARDTVQKIIKG